MKTFIGIMIEIGCLFATMCVVLSMFVVVYIVTTAPHNQLNWLNLWVSVICQVGLFLLIYWIRHTYGYFAKYEKVELWIKRE
jgi:hypothetical protein